MLRRSLLPAAAAILFAAPAASAQESVSSGALRATIEANPWHLSFVGAPRSAGLREDPGTGTGPTGRLGFGTPGGWRRATRVVSARRDGPAYEATLATTDPLGREIAVRLAPDADGVIGLAARVTGTTLADVSAVGISFAATDTERFLGFGERSNAVDQRGGTVENRVTEGPYQPNEQPFVAAFVPPPGQNSRPDATYFPIPWLLSTRGYGVLVDNDEVSNFHLASDRADAWTVQVSATRLRLRVFAGPRPADALRRMTARLGRQPRPAAPWYFGPWFQPAKGHDEAADLRTLQRADAPVSVAQTYTHYLPCADHLAKREEQRERTRRFHASGLAVTTYFNPMLCTSHPAYARARSEHLLTRNELDQPYEYRYTGSTQFLVGQIDFSAPGATAFYGSLLGEATHDGYDGWMEDFGEYTPTDARSADGTPGDQMHNRYVLLYHRAAYDFSRRSGRALARFNRSGWRGSARYSQLVWGGDPTTDWGFDGLASAVRNGLSMGASGVSLWGSDVGGFFGLLGQHQLTPELLDRWIELGAVSGIMRTQANGSRVPEDGKRRAQIFDPAVLPVWRRYAKLRTQLYPYLAAAEAEYGRSGMPIMRDLALAFGGEAAANRRDDEFMFGPDLLAAPIVAPGQRSRRVYLPSGQWVDLWRSVHTTRSGALALGRARRLPGRRTVSVPAPLSELPLVVRAGAVIPLLAPDVDTLTRLGYARGLVHAADREGSRQLLAFPRGRTRGALGVGERWSSAEGRAAWRLGIAGRRTRRYALQASLSTLAHPFEPCSVRIGRRTLPRRSWRYDRRTRVLRASFRARSSRISIVGHCSSTG